MSGRCVSDEPTGVRRCLMEFDILTLLVFIAISCIGIFAGAWNQAGKGPQGDIYNAVIVCIFIFGLACGVIVVIYCCFGCFEEVFNG